MTNEVERLKEDLRVSMSYRSAMKLYQEMAVLTNAMATGGRHTTGEVTLAVTMLLAHTAAAAKNNNENPEAWLEVIANLLRAEYLKAIGRIEKEERA